MRWFLALPIFENPEKTMRYLERARTVTDHLDITLWWINKKLRINKDEPYKK